MKFFWRSPFWRPLLQGGIWKLPEAFARRGELLITFDDGPTQATLVAARLLEERGARALFFIKGELLPEDPDNPVDNAEGLAIARQLQERGHLLGCHGLRHRRLGLLPPPVIRRELYQAHSRIQAATGMAPGFFRPPYGNWTPWLRKLPRAFGMSTFFWSHNPMDYSAASPEVLTKRCEGLQAGDILLLHCSGKGEAVTQQALPMILDLIKRKGLSCADPLALLESMNG
jgi:peptidoglycan/xylan/chitin deacetylase (PgdA/CDA1 family)